MAQFALFVRGENPDSPLVGDGIELLNVVPSNSLLNVKTMLCEKLFHGGPIPPIQLCSTTTGAPFPNMRATLESLDIHNSKEIIARPVPVAGECSHHLTAT